MTLGCARNEVDSEELAGRLGAGGWSLTEDADTADVVVVNTCGFIESAKQDSINELLMHADGERKVVAVGCLAERYGDQLADSLTEADAVLGFDSYADIAARLDDVAAGRAVPVHAPRDRRTLLPVSPVQRPAASVDVALPGHAWLPTANVRNRLDDAPVAYLKLASGCDRRCTFCAIPSFRGSFVSRPPADVLAEAAWLASTGVRELVLVSENSTSYGKDLGDLRALESLLPQLAAVQGVERVRVSYLQPAEMRPDLVARIATTPGVAPYFDLSFQHSSPTVLRRMKRFGGTEPFLDLLRRARDLAPDLGARSNFIVGFPGETEDDVVELERFLTEARLDAVGVFRLLRRGRHRRRGLRRQDRPRRRGRARRPALHPGPRAVLAAGRGPRRHPCRGPRRGGRGRRGRRAGRPPGTGGRRRGAPARRRRAAPWSARHRVRRRLRGCGSVRRARGRPVVTPSDRSLGSTGMAETAQPAGAPADSPAAAARRGFGDPAAPADLRAAARAQLPRLTDDPIGDPPSQASAWNIANALTVLRLALVPVFVLVLFARGGHQDVWRVLAWAVFAVACITDSVDGDIARKRGLVTEFGKLADPIADKALVGAALIGLSLLGELPWWVTVVVLVREIGVTLLRFWVIRHGVIPASRGGKLKTLLQTVAIGLFVLPSWGWLHGVAWVVMVGAVVVAVATGVDYVARAVRLRRESHAARRR